MRNKISVLSQKLTMGSTTSLLLPRNSIHDAYLLRFAVTVKNGTGSSVTSTIDDVLNAISEIKVVTDATRDHYVLTGMDAALLTAKRHKSVNSVLGISSESLASNATKTYSFTLVLDEGDILAVAHTSVELSLYVKDTTGLGLTVQAAECTVTVKETICSTAELEARFGAELSGAVEPKVCGYTISAPSCSEFVGVFDLPTSTLLKGAVIKFTPSSSTYPSQIGLIRNTPDRVELGKEDWGTRRDLDEMIYDTTFPAGVIIYDFGTQWQANGIGKDGWNLAKHDVELAMKASESQTIRYISCESLVNTTLWNNSGVDFTQY